MGMILPCLFSALHALSIFSALKCCGGLVSLLSSSLRNAVLLHGYGCRGQIVENLGLKACKRAGGQLRHFLCTDIQLQKTGALQKF